MTNIVGTDKTGALNRAEENVYDPFGKAEEGQAESKIENEIKYTGAVLDNSGVYYLSARHYDPNTGRFLQQDTYKGDPYSPWMQNLYAYTGNNPTNYVDPTGHRSVRPAGDIIDKEAVGVIIIREVFPSPKATTPGGAYDERYVRTFQEYNEFMKQYAGEVGNMTEEQYEAILKAADELDARGQMDYKEAAGVIQRKNGKLGLFKQGLVLSENYNSVTFSKNVEGEAIMHSHGKYCTASYRMGPGYDYNNQFSPMDTQTFIQLKDKVTYDVLIGSNGSVWVREKYRRGKSYQVTPAFELAGPKREK